MTRRPVCEDGAAIVWSMLLSSVLVLVLVLGAVVADLLAARQRAAAAADLGALAGAPAAAHSDADACRAAAFVVRANGASLRGCSVADGEVTVMASARPRGPWSRWLATVLGGAPEPGASARAGLR